eukprot:m.286793 g.286793  ORF g.286793 m.286793 type:complete len:393 (+) comp15783_c0_seq8:265-1443(+)
MAHQILDKAAVAAWAQAHPQEFQDIAMEVASASAQGGRAQPSHGMSTRRRISRLVYGDQRMELGGKDTTPSPLTPLRVQSAVNAKKKLDSSSAGILNEDLTPDQTASLLGVIGRMASTFDEHELHSQILHDLSTFFSSGHCLLFTVNEQEKLLQLSNPKATYNGPTSLEFGQGLAGHVADTRKLLISNHLPQNVQGFIEQLDAEPETSTHNLAVIPVINPNQELVAVLQVVNKFNGSTPSKFTKEDEVFLKAYACTIAQTLEHVRLIDAAVRECRSINILLGLARNIFQDLGSLEQVVQKIIRDAATLVDCERCSLFMLDNIRSELHSAAFDVSPEEADAGTCKYEHCVQKTWCSVTQMWNTLIIARPIRPNQGPVHTPVRSWDRRDSISQR